MAILKQHTQQRNGFTLVEMLVVLAIITIITTVTLLSQTSFNRSVLLVDTAHTVALSIREAQFFGLSTRIFSGVSNAGYGINFSEDTPNRYTLFADIYPNAPGDDLGGDCPGHPSDGSPDERPGNCLYDISHNEKSIDYTLAGNFTIASVCGKTSVIDSQCLGADFDTVDVVFLRPNTETVIIGKRGAQNTTLQDACIVIRAPSAGTFEKMIYVSKVGQVAVVNECP